MKTALLSAVMAGVLFVSLPTIADARHHNEGGMKGVFKDISPEGKAIVKEQLKDSRDSRKDSLEKARALHGKVAGLVREGDTSGLKSTYKEIRSIKDEGKANFHENFVEVIGKLSPEDRAKVADKMAEKHEKMEKKRAERKEKRDGDDGDY